MTNAEEVGTTLLLAVGNHLAGLSRHHELLGQGARLVGHVRTAASYRLLARGSADSPNPGLVEVAPEGGARIDGEMYALPPGAVERLARLVRPPPFVLATCGWRMELRCMAISATQRRSTAAEISAI